MSKVIRLSDDTLQDLDYFQSHYLIRLRKDIEKHKDSNFLSDLYKVKSNLSETEWISFAIRFAANHVDD